MNDSTLSHNSADPREVICSRVNELMLKLLDGIQYDIANRLLPSPNLEAYEALCRAEQIRRGC